MLSRRRQRVVCLQGLYQIDLVGADPAEILRFRWHNRKLDAADREFCVNTISGILEHRSRLHEQIARHAENWSLDRIQLISKIILEIGIYGMLYQRAEIPAEVSISECLGLAADFVGPDAVPFINGILDQVHKSLTT